MKRHKEVLARVGVVEKSKGYNVQARVARLGDPQEKPVLFLARDLGSTL